MNDTQQAALRLPISFRVGATGLGVGVGCGVGIGIGAPIDYAGIPALGSMARGLSTGLSTLDGMLGGISGRVAQAARRLPLPGVKAGVGCGLGIGYGYGAGLMLQPAATQQLTKKAQQVLDAGTKMLTHAVSKATGSDPGEQPAGGDSGPPQDAHLSQELPTPSGFAGSPWDMGQLGGLGSRPPAVSRDDSRMEDLLWMVVQQQRTIQELQQETRMLKQAVCALDPSAAVCSSTQQP